MKRIDLLIQLVKNIYKLLKTHFEAPCSCTDPAYKAIERFDNETLNTLVQLIKRIEKQVPIINDDDTNYHTNAEVSPAKELEEVLRKNQVIDILKISDSTYYRHIKNGILVPRQLGNRSFFYHSDLVEALEYSKVRGYL